MMQMWLVAALCAPLCSAAPGKSLMSLHLQICVISMIFIIYFTTLQPYLLFSEHCYSFLVLFVVEKCAVIERITTTETVEETKQKKSS